MMAVGAGFVWIIVANVLALLPSRDHHWTRAYVLIAVGVPLLVWIVHSAGVWVGVAFLIAAASVLRWPVIYLSRWVRSVFQRGDARDSDTGDSDTGDGS